MSAWTTTKGALPLASGARFHDRYDVRREIGRGGMGVVYEVFDCVRATRVALKTMRRLDAADLYRFKNEFRALADVSHPNLASLHELESEGDQTFFTMEYVEGVDFLGHVSRGARTHSGIESTLAATPTPSPEVLSPAVDREVSNASCDHVRLRSALAQLVAGVAALHACGKLHRDLKPSNVLVTEGGRVVVLDFGLVAGFGREAMETVEQTIVGTPEYMSPEQGASSNLTEASDWYSVGVMLYEALSGVLPFDGPPLKVLLDKHQVEPPRPRDVRDDVPDDLDALCMDLLQRDPDRRPTASAILARLGGSTSERPRTAVKGSMQPSFGTAFVGRERHMRVLEEAFANAQAGHASVVYVHGSSGMGKSALVRRYLDALAQRVDAVVLSGRCYERESLPYKALDSIVDALSRYLRRLDRREVETILPLEIHALTRLFPVLDRVEAVSGAPRRAHEIPDPQELRRRAARALRELVARIAVRRPVVLFIDDLQWGDVDSAALIHELLRPPEAPPFLLIASYRSEDMSSPLVAALREVHAQNGRQAHGVHEVEVGALDVPEARELACALLGEAGRHTDAHADAIAEESRGSPLFVDELVRHVTTGESLRWSSSGAKLRLDDVLYSRVEGLPDDARALLEVIAIAGKPITRMVAAGAAELSGERESTALSILRTGRFVRSLRSLDPYDVETYHDRIRETVVARLDPAARMKLHLRVAHALVDRDTGDYEALVVHFREGGEIRKAAELAATAAATAAETLAFDRAASLWRSALELPDLSAEAARTLQTKLGDALANAGRGIEAAEAYLAAADGASAGTNLELRRRVADQLLRGGQLVRGMRAIDEVLAAIGVTLPTATWLVVLSLVFYEIRLRLRGLRFRSRDTSELSAAELTRVDILWSVGAMLATVRPFLAKVFHKRHLLHALRAGEPMRVARGVAIEATTSALAGVPAERRTRALLEASRTLSERIDDPYTTAWAYVADGISSYYVGRFRRALDQCDRAAKEFRDRCTGAMYENTTLVMFSSQCLFHLGEMAELGRRLPVFMQEARQRGDLYLLGNAHIGWISSTWLAVDDPDRATRELDDASTKGAPEELTKVYLVLIARVQIALYLGHGLEALDLVQTRWRALVRAQLLRVQTVRVFLPHLRARAALAALAADASNVDAARLTKLALADARTIAREGLRWCTPLARMVEAAIAARRGAREQAIEMLNVAIDDLDASDMSMWAAAARRRRGELRGGDEGRRLIEEADTKMRAQGVKDPARYCAMLAPGFPAIGRS